MYIDLSECMSLNKYIFPQYYSTDSRFLQAFEDALDKSAEKASAQNSADA